jgi:hypothetical protein
MRTARVAAQAQVANVDGACGGAENEAQERDDLAESFPQPNAENWQWRDPLASLDPSASAVSGAAEPPRPDRRPDQIRRGRSAA